MSFAGSGDGQMNLNAQLEAARRVVESHFVAAGEILTQSVDGIDALVASLDKLVSAVDAKSVAATTEDLQVATQALLGLSGNHQARQNTIDELASRRDGLAKCVADMRASLAYMRAFTVNIKIVSSGIAEAGSAFESFAQEISDCIEAGREQIRQVEEEIMALQQDLSAARSESGDLSSRIAGVLPGIHKELSDSASRMTDHYTRVSSVAEEVTGIARDIQTRVVRILSALQIGDITRQRIEHVQTGLQYLADNGVQPGDKAALPCYALLGVQLSATIEDFHREVGAIEHSMADMASHSRNLLKLRDMAYGGSDGSREGFLDVLANRLEQALLLVHEIEGADSSALKTGQVTAEAASKLGSRIAAIQSLKNDVQYMALNTTIKCAQIGEAARPLSVIAIELRDKGRHLETAAAEGLSAIDELTHAAGLLTGDQRSGLSAAEALEVAAKLIRDARNRTESEIGVLVANGEAVLNVLDKSSARLAFRAELGDTLENVAAELMVMGSSEPGSAESVEEQVIALLEHFATHYTMAQERQVHQRFIDTVGLSVSPAEQVRDAWVA